METRQETPTSTFCCKHTFISLQAEQKAHESTMGTFYGGLAHPLQL